MPPLARDSYVHAASFTHDLDKSESKTPNMVLNDSGMSELPKPKAEEQEQKDSIEEKEKVKEQEQEQEKEQS